MEGQCSEDETTGACFIWKIPITDQTILCLGYYLIYCEEVIAFFMSVEWVTHSNVNFGMIYFLIK